MTRQLNNTTLADIFISDVGIAIPVGLYTMPPERYWYFASSEDIDPYITSGDLEVVHNGVTLSAFDGDCLIHEATDYTTIEKDNPSVQVVAQQAKTIRYTGPIFTVTKPTDDRIDVGVQLSGSAEGKEATYQFFKNGNINNAWMDHEGGSITSDGTPGVITANCRIRAATFSNNRDDSSIDLQFFRNGTTLASLYFTWEIRNKRVAWKTNSPIETLTFNAGDTLRVFGQTAGVGGTKPRSVVVKITLINTDDILGEGGSATDPTF